MRVARKNECIDPERLIGTQLRQNLVGIADDRGTATLSRMMQQEAAQEGHVFQRPAVARLARQ